MTNAMGDIISGDIKDTASFEDAADHDVGMRMAGVVMIDRDPVEARLQVLLHLPHEVAREGSQIGHLVGVFGRYDKAELMPILAPPLDEGLTVSLVLNSRIRPSSLPVPINPIAFKVAKMGIDRLARRLRPRSAMLLLSLRIELDDPHLDSDAT
jgi:hypothetical protein